MKQIILDIETNGLHAITDRITCISYMVIGTNKIETILGEDEKKLLTDFWNTVNDNDRLITFNGDGFDIPFIVKRSVIHNIRIKHLKSQDLRKLVNSFFSSYNKFEKGTLNDWAIILGYDQKATNGKEVLEAFERRDWKLIQEHCEDDIKLTKALYDRCVSTNLIKGENDI